MLVGMKLRIDYLKRTTNYWKFNISNKRYLLQKTFKFINVFRNEESQELLFLYFIKYIDLFDEQLSCVRKIRISSNNITSFGDYILYFAPFFL